MVESNPAANFPLIFLLHNTETQINGIKSTTSSETTVRQRAVPREGENISCYFPNFQYPAQHVTEGFQHPEISSWIRTVIKRLHFGFETLILVLIFNSQRKSRSPPQPVALTKPEGWQGEAGTEPCPGWGNGGWMPRVCQTLRNAPADTAQMGSGETINSINLFFLPSAPRLWWFRRLNRGEQGQHRGSDSKAALG